MKSYESTLNRKYVYSDTVTEKVTAIRVTVVNQGRHTNMAPFRCGYCRQVHLGHRRGAVL
jgi:hypothetical protein